MTFQQIRLFKNVTVMVLVVFSVTGFALICYFRNSYCYLEVNVGSEVW